MNRLSDRLMMDGQTVRAFGIILREKSLAINFEDSQFRRNGTFNFIMSKMYVDKRSRVR